MTENTQKEEIQKIFDITIKGLQQAGTKMQKPDNLQEITNGDTPFGHIFIPTELVRNIWKFGEMVLDKQKIASESGLELMLLISRDARAWVRHARLRWGKPPNSEEMAVMPIPADQLPPENPPF